MGDPIFAALGLKELEAPAFQSALPAGGSLAAAGGSARMSGLGWELPASPSPWPVSPLDCHLAAAAAAAAAMALPSGPLANPWQQAQSAEPSFWESHIDIGVRQDFAPDLPAFILPTASGLSSEESLAAVSAERAGGSALAELDQAMQELLLRVAAPPAASHEAEKIDCEEASAPKKVPLPEADLWSGQPWSAPAGKSFQDSCWGVPSLLFPLDYAGEDVRASISYSQGAWDDTIAANILDEGPGAGSSKASALLLAT